MLERFIAIDNVCAWPNLTRLPDGSIIATIFNQPCHGMWEGDVECWASEDGGRFWRRRGTPAPHEPGTNRMNVAAGLTANGDLVVLASGWSHRPRLGEGAAGHGAPARCLLPWSCRSRDGGRTWSHTEVPLPDGPIVPFGDIVQLHDGTIGACIYGDGPSHFYASADAGGTWQRRGIIQATGLTETTPLVLPDGQLLACARTTSDMHLEMFRSTDQGRTWRNEGVVSPAMQHPASLLNLADGRILLTYGNRSSGQQGIDIRLSEDSGRTWAAPMQLIALDPGDLGYPATVPGNDGELVTAWYHCGIAAHRRYHMGVAVWRVDEVEQRCFTAEVPVLSWLVSDIMSGVKGIAEAPHQGLTTPAGWTPLQARGADGFIDVHQRCGNADGIVYLANRFTVPRPGRWGLRLGHDGGVRVFVDGQAVLTVPETRNPAAPGRSLMEVAIKAGDHELVIALDLAAGKGQGIFFSWTLPKAARNFPAMLR